MKKICVFFLIILLICPYFVNAEDELAKNAKSAILVEVSTGNILFEKNKDEKLSVASLTKMMTQLLILEAVEKGNLNWDEKITTSANASGYGGTQIYLETGEVMTARDLMKGVSMASANDATVVLAERIAGSEEKFVEMMNKKAQELGLKNTNFVNPTGLDEDNHYSSSYDLAKIAIELMKHEEIFKFSSLYEDYLRQDSQNKFWLVNTNKLVRLYEGCDGLKTGFTDNAGYTMAVTAKRNNMRLLSIVLGESVSKVRNKEIEELLDYGFNLYKVDIIRKKGEVIDKLKLKKASLNNVNIILENDITILLKKSEQNKPYKQKIKLDNINLPLKKNSKVGTLELYDNEIKIGSYNLVVDKDIKKKSIINIYLDNLKDIINGNYI